MTHSHSLTLNSQTQTTALAQLLSGHLHPGDVVLLDGPLAAGKTFLIRAMVLHWGTDDDVSSPTYTIANHYHTAQGEVLHIDAYRLNSLAEFHALGLEDTIETAVSLIEWGSRIQDAFDDPLRIALALDPQNDTARHITLTGSNRWAPLFHALP